MINIYVIYFIFSIFQITFYKRRVKEYKRFMYGFAPFHCWVLERKVVSVVESVIRIGILLSSSETLCQFEGTTIARYGAEFDRLISSPKWLFVPHPARQYQPANPALVHSDSYRLDLSTSIIFCMVVTLVVFFIPIHLPFPMASSFSNFCLENIEEFISFTKGGITLFHREENPNL